MMKRFLKFEFQEPGFKHYTIGTTPATMCTKSLTECPVYKALLEDKIFQDVENPDKVFAGQLQRNYAVIVEIPSRYSSVMQELCDKYCKICSNCEKQR